MSVFIAAQAQQCILAGNGDGLPEFENYRSQSGRDNKIIRHHQAIIPSYKFDCINEMCGNITGWGVDVHPAVQMVYTLDLQVWRPSPTVNSSTGTGCYSLVGNNRFTSISLDNGVAEPLIVPSSSDYIQFRPGDVLGFYVEEARDDSDGVVILTDNDFSFIRELVWYASIAPTMVTSRNGDCPYSVGSSSGVLNTLTRAAPVISISTGKSFVSGH